MQVGVLWLCVRAVRNFVPSSALASFSKLRAPYALTNFFLRAELGDQAWETSKVRARKRRRAAWAKFDFSMRLISECRWNE